ncbi:MAG: hypothetical protein RLY71_1471 [Pseudomonadota bacterium]|jgi:tetratricopeptide (TPR) repeat protein
MNSMNHARALILAVAVAAAPWVVLLASPSAHAQVALRAEVAKPLQAAQDLIKSGNPAGALAQAVAARNIANLTAVERATVERIAATAALHAKDNGSAVDALAYLSSDTSVPQAERLTFQEILIGLQRAQGDLAGLARTARLYLDQGGNKAGIRALYLQALSAQKRHADIVDYLQPLLADDRNAALTEPEVTALALAQQSLGNAAGYYNALKRLVSIAPANKDYWRELLGQLREQPTFDPRHELDVARLMAHHQLLSGADAHVQHAQLALKAGYPLEAARALDAGESARAFVSAGDRQTLEKLRQTVQKKVAEDAPQIKALESATSAPQRAELAEILYSKGDHAAAIALYRQALQSAGLRREDELRLHLVVALELTGQRQEAREALASIKSGATARELGRLWTASN